MPYITQKERDAYDVDVVLLADKLKDKIKFDKKMRPGHLNYIITKLLKEVYQADICYHSYNELVGLIECCKLEFYTHLIRKYEDTKIKSNGDVDPI